MKYVLPFFLFLFAKTLHAQTDSLVRYWIYSTVTHSANSQTNNPSYASTREVCYLENGLWKMQSRFIAGGNLYMTGSYADEKATVKEGNFVAYYPSGKLASKVSYKNDREEGLYQTWYENTQKKDSFLMTNGFVAGKGYSWNDDGTVLSIYDLDKEGSGTIKVLGNKITPASELHFEKGKKNGRWIYYAEEGYKEWEITYQMDSIVSYKCFDKNGQQQNNCIFEKQAEPTGGLNAWNKYLQNAIAKYNYPSRKTSKSSLILSGEVQVKFLVNKDGSISDVVVIKSLNNEADNIVRSVIVAAPKWVPGIYKNKPVRSFHTQPITFNVTEK